MRRSASSPSTLCSTWPINLESLSRGEKLNTALVNRLASRVAEIQLPRSSLTGVEKNAFAFGYWTEKHVEQRAQAEPARG